MERNIQLLVHGRGNAWPVPLGETHPFYNRNDPRDLSNAAFSLSCQTHDSIIADVLVDAGHGTIQSLISGANRIPDSICLTHGHMDHTLSVDWVVQSYWRFHQKKRLFPIYATSPVHQFLLASYPHLNGLIQWKELIFGVQMPMDYGTPFRITAFPAYHGLSAVGASMLLFEAENRRVLFTGDLLSPLLRHEDYENLREIDVLIVDANNRFPWPRTNHWSFSGQPEHPMQRSEVLRQYLQRLSWDDVMIPHKQSALNLTNASYLKQVESQWNVEQQPFTILELLVKLAPKQVLLVHYSGAEDSRYSHESMLTGDGLANWANHTAQLSGVSSRIVIPETGQVISI